MPKQEHLNSNTTARIGLPTFASFKVFSGRNRLLGVKTPCQVIPDGRPAKAKLVTHRLATCRLCEKRRTGATGVEWCGVCGTKVNGRELRLENLVAFEENLPRWGCKHPQRKEGKGWPIDGNGNGDKGGKIAGQEVVVARNVLANEVPQPSTPKTFASVALNSQPRLIFTADNEPVNLKNLYRGRSCFLICGGPSFAKLDHSKLRQPGILTMGVNNGAKTFRPNLWTCGDSPDHFIRSVWLDPAILKLAPLDYCRAPVFNSDTWSYLDKIVCDCPNVFFYKRHIGFDAARFLTSDTCYWGNDDAHGGARSVMLPALRLLHYLGIRRIFLLGCDFQMDVRHAYHFNQHRAADSVRGNNTSYDVLRQRFKQLRSIFEAAGLHVFNCNLESKLDAFEKIAFDKAVALCLEEWGNINLSSERTAGLYDRPKPKVPLPQPPRNRFWQSKPVIPPIAHFVWLGSPLPKMAADFIERFKKLNPSMEVKLWTRIPADMPADLLSAAEKVPQLCQQADLVRLWVLFKHGGIYLDTDIYSLRGIEELRHYENFIVQGTDTRLFNGVLGFGKASPVLRLLLQKARSLSTVVGRAMPRTLFGPKLFSEFHREHPGQFNVLPAHYFYIIPFHADALKFIKSTHEDQKRMIHDRQNRMTDGVQPFAVHLWGVPDEEMPARAGRSSFAQTETVGITIIARPQQQIGCSPIIAPSHACKNKNVDVAKPLALSVNSRSLVSQGEQVLSKATALGDDPMNALTGMMEHKISRSWDENETEVSRKSKTSAVVVSFYTRNTPYENDAVSLASSATEQGFDVKLYSISSTGMWESNCAKKAAVCLQALSELRSSILCLDADCWLKNSLPLFQGRTKNKHDIMCEVVAPERLIPPMEAVKHRNHAYTHGGMWNSGVLYFNYSPNVLEFVAEWKAECRANPDVWDQIVLQRLYFDGKYHKRINHKALPDDYCAGGLRIGHRSGFHLHWGRSRPQKWLLLGSAPYIQDWWDRYGSRYVDAGFIIAAMNNAWRVPGRGMNVWFRPNDFKPGRSKRELPPPEPWYYEQPDGWNTRPHWECEGRLSFLDTCYHMLNSYCTHSRTIELHVAGSDFVYDDKKTHFYGKGGLDPLRYGTEFLDGALLKLRQTYESKGCRIVNASNQPRTRLPFERHIIGRF